MPRVIASTPVREELLGEAWRDPDPVRGVLAVRDTDVDVELVAQVGEARLEGPPPGSSDDVSDEEDAQGREVTERRRVGATG